MAAIARRKKKGTDEEIIRLNKLGYSLTTIAKLLNCHPSNVTLRLQGLNTPPADTRRSFMEDILHTFSQETRDRLAERLEGQPDLTIKNYVRELLMQSLEAKESCTSHE